MILKKRTELVRKDVNDRDAKNVDFYPVITAADGAPNFAMRLFEIGPAGHTPFHSHDWEHEVYIIEGNGFIIEEDKRTPMGKSDFIYVATGEKHSFSAGNEGLKMICVVPNKGQPV